MLRCCFLLVLAVSAIAGPREKRSIDEDMTLFKQHNLECQNQYRSKHHVDPLEYDDELNTLAQKYAEELAATEGEANIKDSKYGVNTRPVGGPLVGSDACEAWYAASPLYSYDFDSYYPPMYDIVAFFTQMVWKSTTTTGIGAAVSASGVNYVVGLYSPRGNIMKKFQENVLPPN